MDGSLTYVVPVRDPAGMANWDRMLPLIELTLASLAAGGGRIVVAASPGTRLPTLPEGASLVEVHIPYRPLPQGNGKPRYRAVRLDKGTRIAEALVASRPTGHVMVVDYDDLVSRRLPDHVAAHPRANGWVVDRGYVVDEGRLAYLLPTGFNVRCGTSLIVRADLLKIPVSMAEAEETWVTRWLGSHRFLRQDLAAQGTPLEVLPFAGAAYRVGYPGNTSGHPSVRRRFFPRSMLRQPRALARHAVRLRPALVVAREMGSIT